MADRPDLLAVPPVPGVSLRAAAHADVEALLAFWRVAAEDADRPADRPQALHGLIERDGTALLLAVGDARIVGSVIAGWDGWRAHLYRLAVHPDLRRRGLARWLLAAAERQLQSHGAIRLDAMVLDGNEDGRAAWLAAGFERQANWARWVKPLQP